jgi:hypothetical protein
LVVAVLEKQGRAAAQAGKKQWGVMEEIHHGRCDGAEEEIRTGM